MTYVLDSNTISYWLQKNNQIADRLKRTIRQGNEIVLSPVTYYEVRRGFKHKSTPGKEFAFSLMCKSYNIGEMNLVAWEKAADLYAMTRRIGNAIEDTDILIAAFCIVNNYTLVTNNVKHFDKFTELLFENWLD